MRTVRPWDRASHSSGAEIGSLGLLESRLISSQTDRRKLRLRHTQPTIARDPDRRSRSLTQWLGPAQAPTTHNEIRRA